MTHEANGALTQTPQKEKSFFEPVWECTSKPDPLSKDVPPEKTIFVEAERWVDARNFAVRILGVSEVKTVLHENAESVFPRHQIRWQGTSMNGRHPELWIRLLESEADLERPWDLRQD